MTILGRSTASTQFTGYGVAVCCYPPTCCPFRPLQWKLACPLELQQAGRSSKDADLLWVPSCRHARQCRPQTLVGIATGEMHARAKLKTLRCPRDLSQPCCDSSWQSMPRPGRVDISTAAEASLQTRYIPMPCVLAVDIVLLIRACTTTFSHHLNDHDTTRHQEESQGLHQLQEEKSKGMLDPSPRSVSVPDIAIV